MTLAKITGKIDEKTIDVIPGIRVMAIGIIAWFHIWQQSWLSPNILMPNKVINLVWIPRTGYVWVDMFILLSAFQLFLPYARRMFSNENNPKIIDFYKRRAFRIMPSYYFSVIVTLIVALFSSLYPNLKTMLIDLFAHLTFTHTFTQNTYLWTNINVVLWTVGVLVQFYLIFPYLARLFRRYPMITSISMLVIGNLYRFLFVNNNPTPAFYVNQMISFMDVFAIGMIGAYIVIYINRKIDYRKISIPCTFLAILSLFIVSFGLRELAMIGIHEQMQQWQGSNRLWVNLTFMMFIISSTYSIKYYRWIFSNKVMIYLSAMSYNYYIWHQYIAVKLKAYNIPPSINETPNMVSEKPWQYVYTIIAFILPLLVSIILTWVLDKKLVAFLKKPFVVKKGEKS